MAAYRTSSNAVQGVLADNYDGCTNLTPFIATANAVMRRVVICSSARGFTLTVTEQEMMERWLAAYYYTIADPLYKSRSTNGASGSFFDRSYLEAAYAIDPSGCLKGIIEGKRASMVWLGKNPSEQIDYSIRG